MQPDATTPRTRRYGDDDGQSQHKALWALAWCGVVLAVIIAAWVIGSEWWKQQSAVLGQVPSLKNVLNDTRKRVDVADTRWGEWDKQRGELTQQLDGIRNEVEPKLRAVSRQMQQVSETIMKRVREELARRDAALDTRLANWDSRREQDTARIEALDQQVASLKQQVAQQRAALNTMENKSAVQQKALAGEIAMARETAGAGRNEVRELARSITPQRVDFELTRDHSQYLTPGVAVCLNHTDRARRQVSGYMWVMPDRKTIWFKNQNAMAPIVYYSDEDGKRREVVFTAVNDRGATGYLLLPASQQVVARHPAD